MSAPDLLPLLVTDGEIVELGPYVPSVNDHGVVALTAIHRDGHTSLWRVDAHRRRRVACTREASCPVAQFTSHPDIDAHGALSVYGQLLDGRTALLRIDLGELEVLLTSGDRFRAIAPMGPTMNSAGTIAFRAAGADGVTGGYLWSAAGVSALAETPAFAELDGLPVVNERGEAVVRVVEAGGTAAVWWAHGLLRECALRAEGDIAHLGRFPTIAGDGAIGVAVERRGRGWTYRVATQAGAREVFPAGTFEFVRGGLLRSGGMLAAYVTPPGASPRVICGPGPDDVLFALGDRHFGAPITDYALNPVSGSDTGWIVVRLVLADGRQVVARTARPVAPW